MALQVISITANIKMVTSELRQINTRITESDGELLDRACELMAFTTAGFVRNAIIKESRRILREWEESPNEPI